MVNGDRYLCGSPLVSSSQCALSDPHHFVWSRIRTRIKMKAGSGPHQSRQLVRICIKVKSWYRSCGSPQLEPWRILRPGVADSDHFDEELEPEPRQSERSDPDPQLSENSDLDPPQSKKGIRICIKMMRIRSTSFIFSSKALFPEHS